MILTIKPQAGSDTDYFSDGSDPELIDAMLKVWDGMDQPSVELPSTPSAFQLQSDRPAASSSKRIA